MTQQRQERSMTPEERVLLALELGRVACALYAAGQGITFAEARSRLRARSRPTLGR